MRTNEQDPTYMYMYAVCNITYMEEKDRSVD